MGLPLTEVVTFNTALQRGNRVQVPKLVRWKFKMDTNQVLKVTVHAVSVWGARQTFYAQMSKDGRILLPKLHLEFMHTNREIDLTGHIIEVTLQPIMSLINFLKREPTKQPRL
jgi:hypothetical protein